MKLAKIVAAFAIGVAAPLSAQTDFQEMSESELLNTLKKGNGAWIDQPCEIGKPLFSALVDKNPARAAYLRAKLLSQTLCFDQEKNYQRGAATLAELEREFPEENFDWLGLYFDRRLENADGALARLNEMNAEQLGKLGPDSTWALFRMVTKQNKQDELEDFSLRLADRNLIGALNTELQSGVAMRALVSAVRIGRPEAAKSLLAYIRSPRSYVNMLGDRGYEAAWPEIEAAAGENLRIVGDAYVEWSLARLDTNSSDRDRFSDAAHSLHFAGRYQEAIDLAQSWRERADALDQIEEGDAWAMNIQAYAYDALGRRSEADAVFDQLAKLDPEEHDWVVNFVINRASRLVGHGRWEDGLEAAALARTVADKHGSTYAKMIVANNHACALSKLGRGAEAEKEFTFLRENLADGTALAIGALLCAGKREEAVQTTLDALADDGMRDSLIEDMQHAKFDLFYTPSILPKAHDLMVGNAEIRAVFELYARDIPDRFTPTAYLNRLEPIATN